MYVCICNGVTERDIRQAAEAGCRSLPELTMRTGCGATCGTCLETAAALLDEFRTTRELPLLQVAVGSVGLYLCTVVVSLIPAILVAAAGIAGMGTLSWYFLSH